MKKVALLSVLLICLMQVWGQTRQVTGKVTDKATGSGIPGVSVLLKGSKAGTTTDTEGNFSISVSGSSPVLVVSAVGFGSQEITAIGNNVSVALQSEASSLNEIVVVGYGQVRKRDLTGSVASIKGEELTKVPTTNVLEGAQGKITGVDITRSSGAAGAGVYIRVRGNRSILASNNPIFIVDGVQVPDGNISDFNPNDIQSMEVLKDASSTAIYGSRGANGVIIITTKRGTSGKPKLSFNSYAGVSQVAGYPRVMEGPDYVALKREAYRTIGVTDDTKIFNGAELAAIANDIYTFYPDLLIKDGFQQDYQMSISGGTEKSKIYFSGNYFDEKGLFKMDRYKRYSGRLNADQTINNWLKVGMQNQLTYIDRDIRRDPLNQANKIVPIGSAFDSTGNLVLYPNNLNFINPLVDEQPNAYSNNSKTLRNLLSTYVEITPVKDLSIRSVFAANLGKSETYYYGAKNTIDRGTFSTSLSSITNQQERNISWENIINYNKQISDHSLALTGVTSYLSNVRTSSLSQGEGQLFASQLYYNLGANNQNYKISSEYIGSKLISFTGRANYSYKGRYLLTLTGRSDGSSKLGAGNKWAFFPSVASAWRISDESFMQDQNIFSDLKLRATYGVSGSDAVQAYSTQSGLTRLQYTWDDNVAATAYTIASRIGNSDIKWELTATTNIGLDFGFLNGRISGSIDYYDARTRDLLLERQLPLTSGVNSVIQNVGKTRNRGVEIAINSTNIKGKDLTWNTNLTFSKNKEEIVELVFGKTDLVGDTWFIGHPINVFYDYEKIGIWQTKDAEEAKTYGNYVPGDIRVKDQNGDGKFSTATGIDDRIIVGPEVPKWTGGLNNDIRFKGFDLNVYLFARIGQWIESDYNQRYMPQALENSAKVDYWTPENPTNAFPRPNANRAAGSTPFITTLRYEEASFLKLRNVTLGYSLPAEMLKRVRIDNMRVYVTGKNMHTFSNIKAYDPEGNGSLSNPLTKLFVAGVNIGF